MTGIARARTAAARRGARELPPATAWGAQPGDRPAVRATADRCAGPVWPPLPPRAAPGRRVSARIGVRAEVHAELVGEHPVAEVFGRHDRPPLVAGPGLLRLDPLPHLVADQRDRPGGAGDLRHEDVGVGNPERVGDAVLLLQHEAVTAPPGDPVQLDSGFQQDLVGRPQPFVVAFEQHRPGECGPAQRVHVAQPAAALLQIGFEQERELPERLRSGHHGSGQRAEPLQSAVLPSRLRRSRQLGSQVGGTADGADIEQGRGRVEIVGRQTASASFIVRTECPSFTRSIPDRIPERLRDPADVAAVLVHEQRGRGRCRGTARPVRNRRRRATPRRWGRVRRMRTDPGSSRRSRQTARGRSRSRVATDPRSRRRCDGRDRRSTWRARHPSGGIHQAADPSTSPTKARSVRWMAKPRRSYSRTATVLSASTYNMPIGAPCRAR